MFPLVVERRMAQPGLRRLSTCLFGYLPDGEDEQLLQAREVILRYACCCGCLLQSERVDNSRANGTVAANGRYVLARSQSPVS